MLDDIFYWVLNMSIAGIFVGALICLLRFVKQIPRFAIYSLWSVAFIRLCLPVAVSSRFSLMNLINHFATRTVPVYQGGGIRPEVTFTNSIMAAQDYFPLVYKTNLLETVFKAASVIWMIGAVAAILATVMMYCLTKGEINKAVLIKDNIYQSNMVLTPTVYGIFKQKIVLPENFSPEGLSYILAHERVHIRRRDNFWRMAAILTACVHWFNPFVWFYLRRFFSDMELACDAKVMRALSGSEQKEYAKALLLAGENQRLVLTSAFGGSKIKVRVENILSYKKITVLSAVAFGVLFAAVAFVLLTNAAG